MTTTNKQTTRKPVATVVIDNRGKAIRKPISVQVPGLPGAGYVWRRRTILVNQVEYNLIRKWKDNGFQSKSAMILSVLPHRVYKHV